MAGRPRILRNKFLIPLAVIVLIVVLAPLLIPRQLVRDLAVSRLTAALQRPVAVADVKAGLWPRPHVELAGLEVGRKSGDPLTALRLDALRLTLAWGPLLKRQVEVVSVELDRPRVEVALAAPAAEEPGGTEPVAGSWSSGPAPARLQVAVRRLAVRDASVTVRRADGQPALHLGGLDEDLSAELSPAGDLALRGVTRLDTLRVHLPQGTLGEGMAVAWTKDLRFESAAGRLTVAESTLRLGDLPVAVSGQVDSLGGARPVADLQLAGGPVQAASLLGYLPSHIFPALEGVRSAGTLALQGSLRGPLGPPAGGVAPFAYDVRFDLTDGRLEHPQLTQPVSDLELHLRAVDGRVQLIRFAGATPSSRLTISGEATELATSPVVDLRVEADLDLAEVTALQTGAAPPEVALGGRFAGEITLKGPAADPAALDVRGRGRLTDVSATGPALVPPVRDLDGPVRLAGDTLHLDGVFLRQGDSDYRLTGSVRNYLALAPAQPGRPPLAAPPAVVTADVHSDRLDADQYAQKKAPAGAQGGAGGGAGTTPADAEGGLARLALLEGRVALTAGEVLTRGHRLTDVRGTVILDRGLLRFENAAAGLYGGAADLGGSIDLRDPRRGRLDLTVQMRNVQAGELSRRAVAMSRFAGLAGCVSGVVGGQATLRGALDDTFGLDLKTFSSAGSIELDQARLSGHPLQSQLAGYLNTPSLETLAVQKWLQPFRIEDGRLHVDGLDLRAGDLQLKAAGWQSLEGTVDMQVQLTLPAKMAQGVRGLLPAGTAQLLLDGADQPLILPLSVQGQATSPRIGLDAGSLTAQASARAQGELRKEQDRLTGQLQNEARRQLDLLLGGKGAAAPADSAAADSTAADSAAAGADSAAAPAASTEDKVKSLLKRLGGG